MFGLEALSSLSRLLEAALREGKPSVGQLGRDLRREAAESLGVLAGLMEEERTA
jgi:hypothetical protein